MTTPILPGASGGLAEALNILLDKGLVIDASVRITVIGIEILAIEVKVIIASVDTYIRYLEAMQRLEAQRRQLDSAVPTPPPASQGIAGAFGILPPVPVGVAMAPAAAPQAQVVAADIEQQQ
ncbi:gas vesicle protein GvpJ [Actinophytocola sp.]|uniref:gas vesicle protein GvpJ n=1 Tax=Actinophytocola sp. TaxID=1872138 RepID=UPI002ED4EDEB